MKARSFRIFISSPGERWPGAGGRIPRYRADRSVVVRGHEAKISAVTISPDSHWLVTGDLDGAARLWNLNTENPAANPLVLSGHKSRINALAFSSNYRWLVARSHDDTAPLWPLQVTDLLDLARVVASRNFTTEERKLYFQDKPYRKTFSNLLGPRDE
jgi:WD40 repeat protein